MILEPGMKVECVDDGHKNSLYRWGGDPIIVGRIYTVLSVGPTPHPDFSGRPSVFLVEAKNITPRSSGLDYGYSVHRFRPIRNRDTSIEIFREIDANVFKRVDA